MNSQALNIDTAAGFKRLAIIDSELRAQPGEPNPMDALALYRQIEDEDLMTCDTSELESLIGAARDPFARGYLSGVWAARLRELHECSAGV